MWRPGALAILLLTTLTLACKGPAEPERRSLIGSWTSTDLGNSTVIHMTLTETAREVRGAGSWIEPTRALAFRVEGAHAEQMVALFLQFQTEAAVGFRGEFRDQHTLSGTLTGGGFRERSITFLRAERE